MAVSRPQFPPVTPADRELFNPFTKGSQQDDDQGPFRIGELSRRSGVAVGTIKFYLREGLIPVGQPTAKTQALYGAAHLRRLRVVRVLAEVGGLSIAQIREVVAVLDGGGDLPGELAQLVSYSIDRGRTGNAGRSREGLDADDWEQSLAATNTFVSWLGLDVDAGAPARANLADALHALRALGIAHDPLVFTEHARMAYELAEIEIDSLDPVTDRSAAVEAIAVGAVVFGSAFIALRSMAQEHETRLRLDAAASASAPPAS